MIDRWCDFLAQTGEPCERCAARPAEPAAQERAPSASAPRRHAAWRPACPRVGAAARVRRVAARGRSRRRSALAYLIAAPAEPRPRRRPATAATCSRARASRCGTTAGTAATTCCLLAARARARRAARAAAARGAVDDARDRAVRALIDGRFPRARHAHRGALVRARRLVALLASRVPFDLGLAIGARRARCCAQRERCAPALALAALTQLAGAAPSPARSSRSVAARAGRCTTQRARAGPRERCSRCAAALVADRAARAARFPEGGTQPFVASAFYPALAGVLIDRARLTARASSALLRIGALLYALALIAAYCVPSAVGGNADRLGRARRGPARGLRRSRARRRRGCARALLVLAPFLLYWQVNAPVVGLRLGGRPTRRSTPPTTRRCSASCARSESATGDARRGSRWCRRATTGRRAGSRRT